MRTTHRAKLMAAMLAVVLGVTIGARAGDHSPAVEARSEPRAPGSARSAEIPPPPDTFPAAEPAPLPERLDVPAPVSKSAGTWALIIGIDDYPGRGSDLRSAVNDANDMGLALDRYGVPLANRMVLRDGEASGEAIRRGITWLADRAGPDAVAVVFFAGHIRKLAPGREALVGADGDVVSDVETAERLRAVEARRSWIVLAGCYAGGFTEVQAPGRVLAAASPANRLAYENLELGRSYLVQYLVREAILQGRAGPTVQESFAYARVAIARAFPNRMPVQVDWGTAPLDPRQPGAAIGAPVPVPTSAVAPVTRPKPSPKSAPANRSPEPTQPSPAPRPTTTTTQPSACGGLNINGVVTCTPS